MSVEPPSGTPKNSLHTGNAEEPGRAQVGNASTLGNQFFDQGYTLAAVIANEFGEAASDKLHAGALIAAGLVLFVLTLIVNFIARGFVARFERRGA